MIRYILLVLLVGGALSFLVAKTNLFDSVQELAVDVAYRKDFRVTGVDVLNSKELLSLLPVDRNSLWWRLNGKVLQGSLLAHPLVASAHIEPCTFYTLSCYTVSVVERKPEFIALGNRSAWIIGSDGGFIAPLPVQSLQSLLEMIETRFPDAVLLEGLLQENSSPDLSRARFQNIKENIRIIEKGSEHSVHSLELKAKGEEASVKFRGLPFLTTFTLESEDPGRTEEEVRRFVKVLEELNEKFHLVEKVDLAFDELAVVTFKEQKTD